MAQVGPQPGGVATYNQQMGATVIVGNEERRSYVCLSFFSLILSPFCGIIALIFGCCSKCSYNDGDFQKGSCLARCACGWALTGIITTIVIAILIVVLFFAAPEIFWTIYILVLAKAHGFELNMMGA
ncbi:unnamed protein product [Owenia fusiformis]|uniref:Uncharacterized protein n=1 Tax=Owenia fusiformis TaxID=6347 RepID=A0A8J1T821_OWEFU|nr:unnamed protein product [Owenia fusiformis]